MFLRCYKEVENLPRFGLVSSLKAQERRVRVVPIIGGESDDKEFHRSTYLSHSCVDLFGGSGYKELYRSRCLSHSCVFLFQI